MKIKTMLGIGAFAIIGSVSAQEIATATLFGDIDPNGAVSACVEVKANLRYKMRDAVGQDGDVNMLQDFLITAGFMQGESTGYFGAGTLKAVKLFQQKQGLTPTGYVGVLTREKIKKTSCSGDLNVTIPVTGKLEEDKKVYKVSPPLQQDPINFTKTGSEPLSKAIEAFLTEEDRMALKQTEESLVAARNLVKGAKEKIQAGDSSDGAKQELEKDLLALKAAEERMNQVRKAIFEKVKNSLTEDQKKKLEEVIKKMPNPTQDKVISACKEVSCLKEKEVEKIEKSTPLNDVEEAMRKYKELIMKKNDSSVRAKAPALKEERGLMLPPLEVVKEETKKIEYR